MDASITTREFRKRFGLSQAELAKLLQISRSQVTMMENGKRAISIDLKIKLLELQKQLSNNDQGARTVAMNDVSDGNAALQIIRKELTERLEDIQIEMISVRRKFNNIVGEHGRLISSARDLRDLITMLPENAEHAILMSKKMQTRQKRLSACGETAQLRLRIKKDLLLAEANVISQHLGKEAS